VHAGQSPSSDSSGAPPGLGRLAIVIVSYRSAAHLAALLPGLPRDELAAVTVVDNASDDDGVQVARAVPGVQVVANARNVGFGAGCNIGATASPPGASMLLFLNPDARIATSSLETLLAYLDANPRCALTAPRLFRLAAPDEPVSSAGRSATLLTELRRFAPLVLARRLPERRFPPSYSTSGPVDYVEGACMLVDRARFEAAGGFDEAFFLFFEELDLANRLRAAGWTVDLAARVSAQHEVGASRSFTPYSSRPELVESTVRYLAKWRGRRQAHMFVTCARMLWQIRVRRGQLARDARSEYLAAATRALSDAARSGRQADSAGGPPGRSE
jgi:N-acetylglucosaminyl-diphospho-decaprenol L-rhamnosyltransferase